MPSISAEIPGIIVSAWSPDGRRLVGCGCDTEGGQIGVFFYSPEEGTYRQVRELGGMPQWLGDDRWICFSCGVGQSDPWLLELQ